MRIYLTGASGFVGSNLAHIFALRHGAEVIAPGHEHVDLTDEAVVGRSVAATGPDAIVHAAIWNDPGMLRRDWRRAWDAYVGATRNVVAAANAVGAQVVLISTDWVFDGTQGPSPEDAAELVWRALQRGVTGVLHCCGGEHADRVGLARRAVAAFELDLGLLDIGPAPEWPVTGDLVPRDTRLSAVATAAALDVELPSLDAMLLRLRAELEGPARPKPGSTYEEVRT